MARKNRHKARYINCYFLDLEGAFLHSYGIFCSSLSRIEGEFANREFPSPWANLVVFAIKSLDLCLHWFLPQAVSQVVLQSFLGLNLYTMHVYILILMPNKGGVSTHSLTNTHKHLHDSPGRDNKHSSYVLQVLLSVLSGAGITVLNSVSCTSLIPTGRKWQNNCTSDVRRLLKRPEQFKPFDTNAPPPRLCFISLFFGYFLLPSTCEFYVQLLNWEPEK